MSATSRGCTTSPAVVSTASTRPAAATGRQRREGSVPVGKSRNMNATVKTTAGKLHSASVPTCFAAGSDPGNVASPSTAYTEAIARNACAAPAASMIQPMTLPARRTMSAPSVA